MAGREGKFNYIWYEVVHDVDGDVGGEPVVVGRAAAAAGAVLVGSGAGWRGRLRGRPLVAAHSIRDSPAAAHGIRRGERHFSRSRSPRPAASSPNLHGPLSSEPEEELSIYKVVNCS